MFFEFVYARETRKSSPKPKPTKISKVGMAKNKDEMKKYQIIKPETAPTTPPAHQDLDRANILESQRIPKPMSQMISPLNLKLFS